MAEKSSKQQLMESVNYSIIQTANVELAKSIYLLNPKTDNPRTALIKLRAQKEIFEKGLEEVEKSIVFLENYAEEGTPWQ